MSHLAIDESSLLSVEHIRSLLGWVQQYPGASEAVFPFLASMAGAALLPSEAAALRVDDAMLPEGVFGELLVRTYEGRKVPVTPELAGVLRHRFRWPDRSLGRA